MKRFMLFSFLIGLSAQFCGAQIRITSANIDTWIKSNLAGQGVVVGNISHHGSPISQATFTSTGNVLQLQRGLVLSSGNVFNISGFNNSYNQSTALGNMSEPETDEQLSKLLKERLYDISYVEFDFVPMANSIQFNYQFGSDEYPEYVGSAFNDIFAFFISDGTSSRNIAIVPGKAIPVSINTINSKSDFIYYIDNNPFSQVTIKRQAIAAGKKVQRSFFGSIWHGIKKIFSASADEGMDRTEILPDQSLAKKLDPALYRNLKYDGITKKLTAQAYVEPYKKYHLKIVIADVSDNIYDSGVFVEDHSLTAKRDSLQPGFVPYPEFSGIIDPNLLLQGKKLEDILPDSVQLRDAVIYFDFDKSEILSSEIGKINMALTVFDRIKTKYNMYISGHTDSLGSLEYNYALSKRRNQAVIDAFQKLHPDNIPFGIIEKAYLVPAAENNSDNGRKLNRRVEITFKRIKQ